jgi:hypothetical protein
MALAVAPAHTLVLTVSHRLAFGSPFLMRLIPPVAHELSLARKQAHNARTGIAAAQSTATQPSGRCAQPRSLRPELHLAVACSNALALPTFQAARRSRSALQERSFKPMKHLEPEWRTTNPHVLSWLPPPPLASPSSAPGLVRGVQPPSLRSIP